MSTVYTREFFEMAPTGYSKARRKLNHDKNLKSKISCQASFNVMVPEILRDRTSLQGCKLQEKVLGITHYQGCCEG
jgi:hypothetical protein